MERFEQQRDPQQNDLPDEEYILGPDERKFLETAGLEFDTTADNSSIGGIVRTLASHAFHGKLGRDQAVYLIKRPEIFGEKGKVWTALRRGISREIDQAYGRRQGRRALLPRERRLATKALSQFLESMKATDAVNDFFAAMLRGEIDGLALIADTRAKIVDRKKVLGWATSNPLIKLIAKRLRTFVEPIVSESYQSYIKEKPDEYIGQFTPRVLEFGLDFKLLEELMRDVCESINFDTFWGIFEAAAIDCLGKREATELADKFKVGLRNRFNYIKRQNGSAERAPYDRREIERRTEATRRGIAQTLHFVFPDLLSAGDGKLPHKIPVKLVIDVAEGEMPTVHIRREVFLGDSSSVQAYVRRMLFSTEHQFGRTLADLRIKPTGALVEQLAGEVISFGRLCQRHPKSSSHSNKHNGRRRNGHH